MSHLVSVMVRVGVGSMGIWGDAYSFYVGLV